jgi:hypothetical protein
MRQTLGLVESAWFFRRGDQSVRIVRLSHADLKTSLRVDGPGQSHVIHRFDDQVSCTLHQSEIERRLVKREFHLERATGKAARPGRAGRAASAPAARRSPNGLRLLLDPAASTGPYNDLPPAA